ncbi:MAG: RnfABCDGE type electron transport complex subunit B [Tissierellia bacterium]|nr:RnfABCDGE type electron transport complex subunit B [Tissierellia bacterium]
MDILKPVLVLGALGLLFGVLLSIASRIFEVKLDPLVGNILGVLPGANCGACGFPGCEGLANAIAAGKAPVTACTIGGDPVAQKVAELMGTSADSMERMVAVVRCNGTCEYAGNKYQYHGLQDCRYLAQIGGGNKECYYGCLGCGTCKDVCPFDAIEMVDGVAVIIKDKCMACNKCIEICPKNIIELMPYKRHTVIKCASKDKGKIVRSACSVGCIGCQACVKKCPKQTITFADNLAHIDYTGCIDCGICVKTCPMKTIHTDKPKRPPRPRPTKTETEKTEEKELVGAGTKTVAEDTAPPAQE